MEIRAADRRWMYAATRMWPSLIIAGMVLCIGLGGTAGLAFDSIRVDGNRSIPKAAVSVTGSATLISPANGNRKTLSCTIDSTANVRWGDSSVTASTGQRIQAGSAVAFRNPAAIYMVSEGATVQVFCTEEIG